MLEEWSPVTIPYAKHCLTLSQTTNFRLSQIEEFAHDKFKLDANDGEFSLGSREIVRLDQSSFSHSVFKYLYCGHVKTKACVRKS